MRKHLAAVVMGMMLSACMLGGCSSAGSSQEEPTGTLKAQAGETKQEDGTSEKPVITRCV